jgi:uncharacterized protein
MSKSVEKFTQQILPILTRYGVSKAGLFGSCVREEMKDGSDIDVLVEIEKDISLFDFVEIKLALEEATGYSVDLVEYKTIKPLLKDSILNEELRIL